MNYILGIGTMLVKLVLLFILTEYVCSDGEKEQPTFTYQSGDSQVFVFDRLIKPSVAKYMKSLLIM